MSPVNSGRSNKVVGLFLAAALSLTPGCSMNQDRGEALCADLNQDGYCDDDGRSVAGDANRHRRTGFLPFFGGFGSNSGTRGSVSTPSSTSPKGVSSGSKGGIGSSSRSGGGSSGG